MTVKPRSVAPQTVTGNANPAANRLRRLLLLFVAGVILVGSAGWLRSSPWLREPILRGKDLPELEALVQSAPHDALAQYHLAKRYYLQRRFADAATAYETTARLEPNAARAYLGLALSRYELGQTEPARRAFVQTLERDPRSAWAEYMLGKMLWQDGNVAAALPHVRRATQLDPRSDPAWYGLGVCHAHLRQYSEAITALQNAVARRDSPQYHTALGEMLIFKGNTDKGKQRYEHALQLQPNYGPACALLGAYYLHHSADSDALDRAEALLKRATHLRTTRPATVWLDLGQVYYQKTNYSKAVATLRESLRRDPGDERAYYTLANTYRRMGNAQKAEIAEARFRQISALNVRRQELEARLWHDPSNVACHVSLARVYHGLGLTRRAAEQYQAALNVQPAPKAALVREWQQFVQAAAPPTNASAVPGAGRDFVLPPLRP